ncbi:hypothetical protein AWB78_08032 [Caballeronia calidae]|uniref:Uncharacterized protein n=1 Tax=Caballeronia calidae TaxID=1777139 RepID=A0A158EHS2_9BURK|nr:hypothetical protein [Caballeronia calidae]SAL06364.1 hypothetical protein AWB78_08032 [Caballeronia calidae]
MTVFVILFSFADVAASWGILAVHRRKVQKAVIQFKCVSKGDSEFDRPNLMSQREAKYSVSPRRLRRARRR